MEMNRLNGYFGFEVGLYVNGVYHKGLLCKALSGFTHDQQMVYSDTVVQLEPINEYAIYKYIEIEISKIDAILLLVK